MADPAQGYASTRGVGLRRFILAALVVLMTVSLEACSRPASYSLQSDEEFKKEMDTRINESPTLQAIDHFCTNEIPIFDGFKFMNRGTWEAMHPAILYSYRSDTVDHLKVKRFYEDYFKQHGWQPTNEPKGGIGTHWFLEFRKAEHTVLLDYYGPFPGGDTYSIRCEKRLVPTHN